MGGAVTRYVATVGGLELTASVDGDRVEVDGRPVRVEVLRQDGDTLELVIDSRPWRVRLDGREEGRYRMSVGSRQVEVLLEDEVRRRVRAQERGPLAGPTTVKEIRAPMPGMVVAVEVEEGSEVRPGQPLVIIEAMKMENEIRATSPGRVREVGVEEGQPVEKDQVLVVLA